MDLYPDELKSRINIALEPEWTYIRVDLYLGFYGIVFDYDDVNFNARLSLLKIYAIFENSVIIE